MAKYPCYIGERDAEQPVGAMAEICVRRKRKFLQVGQILHFRHIRQQVPVEGRVLSGISYGLADALQPVIFQTFIADGVANSGFNTIQAVASFR